MTGDERERFVRDVNAGEDLRLLRLAELVACRRLDGRAVGVGRNADGDVVAAERRDSGAVGAAAAPIDDPARIATVIEVVVGDPAAAAELYDECERLGWHAPAEGDAA